MGSFPPPLASWTYFWAYVYRVWVVLGFLGGGPRIPKKDRKGDVETKKSVLGRGGYVPSASCLAFKPTPPPPLPEPISGPLCVSCVGGPKIPS